MRTHTRLGSSRCLLESCFEVVRLFTSILSCLTCSEQTVCRRDFVRASGSCILFLDSGSTRWHMCTNIFDYDTVIRGGKMQGGWDTGWYACIWEICATAHLLKRSLVMYVQLSCWKHFEGYEVLLSSSHSYRTYLLSGGEAWCNVYCFSSCRGSLWRREEQWFWVYRTTVISAK